ncbi:MAG: T9SS type A sorting domain-containing protein [Ferruginibacter sp.]|nr:T9SS type A sorting domain-containing protein [Bacteroidota bacterium]MBX2917688.1 T9SS type A sorting domain-containing protein [Ferruginibacter sp.]MCB0707844.1 T9SS type A sorting domain-containing protein [Chitinophagaceae bacterium]MCC7378272.1 T9SS type A sorting domain-containing protein [Chitinophagaceae bacterium]
MKKIIVILITFSGIFAGYAQQVSTTKDSGYTKHIHIPAIQVKKDSLPVKEIPSAKLFPNPAKNKVEIEVKGFKPGNVHIQLIDKTGKLVRNDLRSLFTGNETIIYMFSENPGIYFLIIKQDDKSLKSKLIIQ